MLTMGNTISIGLLGPLVVVRQDGSVVPHDAWRTGKTMDLLRVLALENGRPVRSSSLVDLLWPHVDPARGRGSLRTAASQIRKAIGQDCLVRQQNDLVLVSATVDVDEYRQLVVAIAQARARQSFNEALLLNEAAETLYRGDLHASDDSAGWAVFARENLRRLRLAALGDAACSALQTGRFREALELATTIVHIEPSSESGHRTLMHAHAELSEIGQALQVFERYRTRLSDELGVDPPRSIRELHLRLLRDE
ncbi:hypothetical protein BH11ACT8_BH11ACT8_22200 [soil metagenome]